MLRIIEKWNDVHNNTRFNSSHYNDSVVAQSNLALRTLNFYQKNKDGLWSVINWTSTC